MELRRILLLNGPNLNMLGKREPDIYGTSTLEDIEEMVASYASQRGIVVTCFQSNSESSLIKRIHAAEGVFDGIVYNPGAHTHYSYALRDAIASVGVPVVEVHISDIKGREKFRHTSVLAPVCVAQVKGLGIEGYCRAVDVLLEAESPARLGEGFESRSKASAHIVVAGAQEAAESGGEADGEDRDGFDDESEGMAPQLMFPPRASDSHADAAAKQSGEAMAGDDAEKAPAADAAQDFALPYAADIAAVDAGMVSHERQSAVRALCGKLGIDALLVRDTPNIQWLTSFDGVFDDERAHALLVAGSGSVLHTDSRYSNAMRAKAASIGSDIVVNDERASHAAFAKEQLDAGGSPFAGRLGIEDSITYAEFVKMNESFGAGCLAATTDVVLNLRAVKAPAELSRMLAAQAVTDAAFEHIVGFMRPGMTEREVQLELEDFMIRHGGEGLAFRSIVATGANGADPHAVPGDTRLQAGQCVVMDFGAKAFGYCSDMTRTVFLGQPDGLMASAWEVLRRANETVEAMLRPGVTGKEAHERAESVLAEGGFGGKMGHGLGHGVGLEVHEQPVLNARNDKPLVDGNVVTVEPGIYVPGQFGMRLEDCGVVTENGYEPFSQLGHDMVVI